MKFRFSLFSKVSLIMIASTAMLLSMVFYSTYCIMEDMFLDAFYDSSSRQIERAGADLAGFNTRVIQILDVYKKSPSFREYLRIDPEADDNELFRIFYDMEQELKRAESVEYYGDVDIIVLGNNGRILSSKGQGASKALNEHPLTIKARENGGTLEYVFDDSGISNHYGNKNSLVGFQELKAPLNGEVFGVAFVIVEESYIQNMYGHLLKNGSTLNLVNSNGVIISSSNSDRVGQQDQHLMESVRNRSEGAPMQYESGKGDGVVRIISDYLPILDMYIVNEIEMSVVLAPFVESVKDIVVTALPILAVTLLLVFIILRRVTKPLTRLVRHMKKNRDGQLAPVEIKGAGYEVRELNAGFNRMMENLESYVDRLVKEQKERRKAELDTLQMQIRPHFLYNTLATIKYLSWQGDTRAVSETTNALIELLQNTIHKSGEMVTIKEEVETLRHYVTINQYRFGDDIQVAYHVNDATESLYIPKLILQPFVENAFFHAYQIKNQGTIRIFINVNADRLKIEIMDDGDGFTEAAALSEEEMKQHFSGIGIQNVIQRIQMLFGRDYGVKIFSQPQVGTTITIMLPVLKEPLS